MQPHRVEGKASGATCKPAAQTGERLCRINQITGVSKPRPLLTVAATSCPGHAQIKPSSLTGCDAATDADYLGAGAGTIYRSYVRHTTPETRQGPNTGDLNTPGGAPQSPPRRWPFKQALVSSEPPRPQCVATQRAYGCHLAGAVQKFVKNGCCVECCARQGAISLPCCYPPQPPTLPPITSLKDSVHKQP